MELNRPNQKEEVPFFHYLEVYRGLDPYAIGKRCALPFDGNAFSLTLMGMEYLAPYPAFELRSRNAAFSPAARRSVTTVTGAFAAPAPDDAAPKIGAAGTAAAGTAMAGTATGSSVSTRPADPEQTACDILILRYLCEGRYYSDTGKRLSYNEVPWGPVYYRNFDGRCLKRLAYGFGNDIPRFKRIIESAPGLKAEKLPQGDAGYRIEFLSGLFISLILYAADDEFPPSAQILFDDNFVFAFTAEDLAVVGEVVIDRLKRMG
ncbi:MAG: DUF3786 domain-containing protein [Spirochaetaceae bacterium]|jgi:hypothetical protein|nr:DUF3786 domain-containing protein [Spirochaetaceae bacterium]